MSAKAPMNEGSTSGSGSSSRMTRRPGRSVRITSQAGGGADDRRRDAPPSVASSRLRPSGASSASSVERRPDAALLGVAHHQVGQRGREGHRQQHHQGAQAEPARAGAVADGCGDRPEAHSSPLSWISRAVPSMSPSRPGSSSGGRSDDERRHALGGRHVLGERVLEGLLGEVLLRLLGEQERDEALGLLGLVGRAPGRWPTRGSPGRRRRRPRTGGCGVGRPGSSSRKR